MRIRLDYGVDGLEVDLPQERITIIEPVFRSAVADRTRRWTAELRAPLGRPPLRDIVRRRGRPWRFPSATSSVHSLGRRRWPHCSRGTDIPTEDITILVATGTHRTNTL